MGEILGHTSHVAGNIYSSLHTRLCHVDSSARDEAAFKGKKEKEKNITCVYYVGVT